MPRPSRVLTSSLALELRPSTTRPALCDDLVKPWRRSVRITHFWPGPLACVSYFHPPMIGCMGQKGLFGLARSPDGPSRHSTTRRDPSSLNLPPREAVIEAHFLGISLTAIMPRRRAGVQPDTRQHPECGVGARRGQRICATMPAAARRSSMSEEAWSVRVGRRACECDPAPSYPP